MEGEEQIPQQTLTLLLCVRLHRLQASQWGQHHSYFVPQRLWPGSVFSRGCLPLDLY